MHVGFDARKIARAVAHADYGNVAQVNGVHGRVVDVMQEAVPHEGGFKRAGEAFEFL